MQLMHVYRLLHEIIKQKSFKGRFGLCRDGVAAVNQCKVITSPLHLYSQISHFCALRFLSDFSQISLRFLHCADGVAEL